jgi:hypothetical protein
MFTAKLHCSRSGRPTKIRFTADPDRRFSYEEPMPEPNSRYMTPASVETDVIVHAVLRALEKEPVWAWAQEQVDEIDRGQQDDGAEMPQDPSELDEMADEEGLGDEGLDVLPEGPDEEAQDLDSLEADLGEAEEDLQEVQFDEQDGADLPVRMSRQLAATTAGQAAAQRHLERNGNDHPLRLMDVARSRGRRDPHAGLRRYEAKLRQGAYERYPGAVARRGSITEPVPTESIYGRDVRDNTQPEYPWRSMDSLLPAKGDPTTVRGTHPDETLAGHPSGSTPNYYEKQRAAQQAALDLARKWVSKSDVGQQARNAAGQYCSGQDEE